jgi:hypothetical protein
VASKKRSKLSPEQRAKLDAYDRERKRVHTLTEKLVERLRPFVEAKNPGVLGDAETAAWETRMRRETGSLAAIAAVPRARTCACRCSWWEQVRRTPIHSSLPRPRTYPVGHPKWRT